MLFSVVWATSSTIGSTPHVMGCDRLAGGGGNHGDSERVGLGFMAWSHWHEGLGRFFNKETPAFREGRAGVCSRGWASSIRKGSEREVKGLHDQAPEPPAEGVGSAVDLGEAPQARLKGQVLVVDRNRDFVHGG